MSTTLVWEIDQVSSSSLIVRGYKVRDALEQLTGRVPVYSSRMRGWCSQPYRIPDILAAAQIAGADVVMTGPRTAALESMGSEFTGRQALTEAGMSTRAIAPVVGVSKSQVAIDQQVSSSRHLTETPAPESEAQLW